MEKKMNVIKTVKIPLHYGNTQTKIRKLDKLTARFTYCVWLWSDIIDRERTLSRTKLSPFEHEIQEKTKLSSGFVQQCKDKAIWCWRQYKTAHKIWRKKLNKAKEGTKWHSKLLKREPSTPFTSARSKKEKCPVRIDNRTGIVRVDLKLTQWILKTSTLVKGQRITLLLNPSRYHKEQLDKGNISDFEIVKRNKKWYAHITVNYEVNTQPVMSIRGVDLGIRRDIATVLLSPEPNTFRIVTDKTKKKVLRTLNDMVSHLRREEKWNVLKRLRNKRNNISQYHDWRIAKDFVANHCHNSLVVVGNPDYIRYNHYKGNGDKIGRSMLNSWSFGRVGDNILHYCLQQGTVAVKENEWGTSSRCSKCGGKMSADGRRVTCQSCGIQYDREFNSTVNIAREGISFLSDKTFLEKAGAEVDTALTVDESLHMGGAQNYELPSGEALRP